MISRFVTKTYNPQLPALVRNLCNLWKSVDLVGWKSADLLIFYLADAARLTVAAAMLARRIL